MQEGRRNSFVTSVSGRGSIGQIGSMYGSGSLSSNFRPSSNRESRADRRRSPPSRPPTWYVERMVDVSSSSLIESGEFEVKAPEHNEAKMKMSDIFDDAQSFDTNDSKNGREIGEGKNKQKRDTPVTEQTISLNDIETLEEDHTIDDNEDDNDDDDVEKEEHDIEAMGKLDTADTASVTSKLTE